MDASESDVGTRNMFRMNGKARRHGWQEAQGHQRRAISAGTSRILGSMEGTPLMQQQRVSPERVRRLTLFGCRRHPDTRQVNKLQASDINSL